MMKAFPSHLLAAALLSLGCAAAQAVTALRRPMTYVQPDGTTLTVTPCGDEHLHFYLTSRGDTLMAQPDGWLVAPRPDQLRTLVADAQAARAPRRALINNYPTLGHQRSLVVLVEYADNHFTVPDPQQTFWRMLNEPGFADYGATGSARDYFLASSSGLFQPDFDVFGPIKLQENMAYYGAESYLGHDSRPDEMAIEACLALNDSVDFTVYDTDHNGVIDNIYVFYAGRSQASGGAPNSIWPHSSDIYSGFGKTYRFDDVLLDHYATSNELDESGQLAGIGTFCHEFSHVLGLPDLYSTTGTSAFTPGAWSVMDYGNYLNGQHTPPLYSSYERMALGWYTPADLSLDSASLSLPALADSCLAYRIASPTNPDEYFLLENRQPAGWDLYLPGHGMLVWHIDYRPQVWRNNSVNNNASHQYVDLLEADGLRSDRTRAGDAFPGTDGITSLTPQTDPALLTWAGQAPGHTLTDIREVDGLIYFEVCGGNPPLPRPVPQLTAATPRSLSLSWQPVPDALGYSLTVCPAGSAEALPGYDRLDLGQALTATVTGLEFDSLYDVSLQAYDRLYRSLLALIQARTLPATFDYLQPRLIGLHAADDALPMVSAQWQPLEGAVRYELQFFTRRFSEPERCAVDFTGGLDLLPAGWTTDAVGLYNTTAYCGQAVPSLQFTADGQHLTSPVLPADVRSLSLWHRSNTATNDNLLILELITAAQQVLVLDTIPTRRVTGGTLSVYGELAQSADLLHLHARQLRVRFVRPSNANVAVDDVVIDYGGQNADSLLALVPTTATEAQSPQFQPGLTVYAQLRAFDAAGLASLWSEPLSVVLPEAPEAIQAVPVDAACPAPAYNLFGQPITAPQRGLRLTPGGQKLYLKL